MKKILKKKNKLMTLGVLAATVTPIVAGVMSLAGSDSDIDIKKLKNKIAAPQNGEKETAKKPIISNFDMNKVRPIAANKEIDYKKPQFVPWVDDGFNWQQFLDQAKMGDTIINDIISSDGQLVKLGFITASDFNTGTENALAQDFLKFAEENNGKTSQTIPAIGGIMPLWMTNWTDSWGAKTPDKYQEGSKVYEFLNEIRMAGKDYVFSFGGWNHDSLAMDAFKKGYTAKDLKDLYASIINALDLNAVNFDNEGTEDGKEDDFGNIQDKADGLAAKKLRNEALKLLKADKFYSDLTITYTLPTFINGLNEDNYALVKDGFESGIIDFVDIMAFDYGAWESGKRLTAPGELAIYAMSTVNSFAKKLESWGIEEPYSKIGITSMMGVNDQKHEVWTLTDQALMTNFAITKGLNSIGMWETFYDTEQQIYNAKDVEGNTSLREGHTFGLWSFDEMLNNTRTKDAYSSGLNVADLSYTKIAQGFNKGKEGLYNFDGKVNIDQIIWNKVKELGISEVGDVNNITQQDIEALYSNSFIFEDGSGFGADLFDAEKSKELLTNELNFAAWKDNYLDKDLK